MKKRLKTLLIIITIIFLCLVIDISSIFIFNKPIFAVKSIDNDKYVGVFYDVYSCPQYSILQIKMKGTKFKCSENILDSFLKVKESDKKEIIKSTIINSDSKDSMLFIIMV